MTKTSFTLKRFYESFSPKNLSMRVKIFNSFKLGKNHLGKAVFAARSFKPRDVLTQFTGSVMSKREVPAFYEGENDRYLQIGVNKYMGASNTVDDYMNHSCDPNTGLKFTSYGIILVALKRIATGDEITWDYSTTMYKNDWVMKCKCDVPACRKEISEFLAIPKKRQTYYLEKGVVAPYIVRTLRRQETEQTKPIPTGEMD